MTGQDSTGKRISIGSKVRFRGKVYTIKEFIPEGLHGPHGLVFEEPLHVAEAPDEFSVDLVDS